MTPGRSTKILSYSFSFNGKFDPNTIILNTTSRLTESSSYLTTQICTLHYAQVSYPIRLHNGTVELLPQTKSNETQTFLYLPLETTGMGTFPSSLGGIQLLAQRKFGATASLYMNGAPYELDSEGETSLAYLDMLSGTSDTTDYTFLDPTSDMLSALREIMFRYSIFISNATETQKTRGTDMYTHQLYTSDYRYLAAAGVLMLAAILASSANLWGWWELHREFTLGPFEIAKAFNAPYFEDVRFYGCKDGGFVRIMGRPIRYGEIVEVEMNENVGNKAETAQVDTSRVDVMPVSSLSADSMNGGQEGVARRQGWKDEGEAYCDSREDGRRVKLGMGFPSTYR